MAARVRDDGRDNDVAAERMADDRGGMTVAGSKRYSRRSLAVLVAGMLAGTAALAGCTPGQTKPDRSAERLRQSGVLRVAIDPSYPPFASLDAQGEIVGYDVDLAREIARRLEVKAAFVPHDVGSILDALVATQADLVVSAIPPYREYSRKVLYSRPYYNAGQVVLTRRQPDGAPVTLDGKVVGFEFGTGGELVSRKLPSERGTPAESRSFVSPEAAIDALRTEQIDAFITDRVLARLAIKANPGFVIVGEPLDVDPYVIAIGRNDAWLAKRVDEIVGQLTDEGFLNELEDRWL